MSLIQRLIDLIRPAPANAGARAEAMAERYLVRRGLKLIERNYRCRGGEIDLICRDSAQVVFVEVRLRSGASHGGAAASITRTKQRRIIQAARHWLAGRPECSCRFDVILMDRPEEAAIEWIRDAFHA